MVTRQNQTASNASSLGLLARFRSQDQLLSAARELRHRGYQQLEAFSPFPIHGLDEALGVRPTRLPWLVLAAGIIGGAAALALQWWTNAVDYPFLISGKPLFSLPANIPVTFEVVILGAAFAAFAGMLLLNGLPQLANPLFHSDSFRAATNDGFFLMVDATDPQFDPQESAALLQRLDAADLEVISDTRDSPRLPRAVVIAGVILGAIALVPPVMIAAARSTTSEKPRLHNFFDMDFQPKLKSQTTTTLFADGRAMRPRVTGTVPRGELQDDTRFYLGREPVTQPPPTTPSGVAEADESVAQPDWTSEIPLPVTDALMERGRERYNIHCAVCHGRTGEGNGLASIRALELQQGTWIPPTSIHADYVRQQPVGQLYNTITNGVRKMPPYGHQIPPEDRWAIVLYLRALQRSQHASIGDVPPDVRATLRELN